MNLQELKQKLAELINEAEKLELNPAPFESKRYFFILKTSRKK